MRTLATLALLLAACSGSEARRGGGADNSGGPPSPVADPGGEGEGESAPPVGPDGGEGEGEGEAAPEQATRQQYRADSLVVLPPDQGMDFDADGEQDNGLGALFTDPFLVGMFGDPNDFLRKEVGDGDLNLLFDFGEDATSIDVLLGDATPDGEADYGVQCDALDDAGEPRSRFPEALAGNGIVQAGPGSFEFVMTFAQGTVLVFRDAHLLAEQTADPDGLTNGRIMGVLSLAEVRSMLENDPEVGTGFLNTLMGILQGSADIDSTGDGGNDSMSATFGFTAVPTRIDRQAPCR